MRDLSRFVALLSILALPFVAQAKEAKEVGPHGGRLMKGAQFKVEFHLDKDRKAHVYLYGQGMEPANPEAAKVTLRAMKGGAQQVELVKVAADPKVKGSTAHLVSKKALLSPDGYLISLTVKVTGKPLDSFRFNFLEETCGECGHPEYACICGH